MKSRDDVATLQPALERAVLVRLQWIVLFGGIEFLALSLWLDTAAISSSGLLRLVLKKLPDVALFAILGAALAVFISGIVSWNALRREIVERRIAAKFPWGVFSAHLACLAAFVAVSSFMIVSSATPVSPAAAGLQLAWIVAGLATAASWFAALLPWQLWPAMLKAGRTPLLIALPLTVVGSLLGRETRHLWDRLAEPTLSSVDWLLRACGERTSHDAASARLQLGDFQVTIDPHCSGYEGVGVMAVFSLVYVWAMREQLRFPQAWLLAPLAMFASWAGNVLRIALLLELGARFSPAIALGGFHSQAGWLFLILISGLTVGVAQRSRFFSVESRRTLSLAESPAAACLVPFLLWNIIGIVSVLTSADPQVDPWYPFRLLAVVVPAWYWRKVYGRMLAVGWEWPLAAGLGVLGFAVWMLLESLLHPSVPDQSRIETSFLWMAARIAGSCLAIPLIEELAFRGYLFRRVQAFRFEDVPFRDVGWPGWIVSAAAFGALHGDRWFAGIVVGLLFALAARLTGRLSSAVIAHATINTLLTIYVLLTGDYARWH